MKIRNIIWLAVWMCCQCSRPAGVVYEGMPTADTVPLKVTTLNASFPFSWPQDLLILDTLLVVHDAYQRDECLHLFRKSDGGYLRSFARKGRGPGECGDLNAVNAQADGTITVYDPSLRKAIVYDLTAMLANRTPSFREYPVRHAPDFIRQMLPLRDGFVAKGNDDKLRFGFWNPANETFRAVYTDYPPVAKDAEDNWAVADYAAKVRISPDGRRLASATYIGGVLELFDISRRGFAPRAIRCFFAPRYGYADGGVPRWITTQPETVIGFQDLFLTDEAVYGLLWGCERSAMESRRPSLLRFDYAGNPVACYLPDRSLECVAVDVDGTIYGVGSDSDGEYALCRYSEVR